METTDTTEVQPRVKTLGKGTRRRRVDPAEAAAALGGDDNAEGSPAQNTPPVTADADLDNGPSPASASSTTSPPVGQPSGGQPAAEGPATGNVQTAEQPMADTRPTAVEGPHDRESTAADVGTTDGRHGRHSGDIDVPGPDVDLEAAFANDGSEPPADAAPPWATSPPGEEARADEEDRTEPTGDAEDGDEETYAVSTYLTAATKHAARKFRKDQGTTMASVALDAIDNTISEGVLVGLLKRRHIEPRPDGSVFPPRTVRRRRPPKTNPYQISNAASLQQVYLTQAELQIVADIERDYGAVSRSEVLAVALEYQFFRPDDKEIAQLRLIGLERRGVKPVPLDDFD